MTGSTFLVIPPPDRFVPRLPNVGDVVGEDPEFGTSCNIGSSMDFLKLRRAVSVYVATNGKNGKGPPIRNRWWLIVLMDKIIVIGRPDLPAHSRRSQPGGSTHEEGRSLERLKGLEHFDQSDLYWRGSALQGQVYQAG